VEGEVRSGGDLGERGHAAFIGDHSDKSKDPNARRPAGRQPASALASQVDAKGTLAQRHSKLPSFRSTQVCRDPSACFDVSAILSPSASRARAIVAGDL